MIRYPTRLVNGKRRVARSKFRVLLRNLEWGCWRGLADACSLSRGGAKVGQPPTRRSIFETRRSDLRDAASAALPEAVRAVLVLQAAQVFLESGGHACL